LKLFARKKDLAIRPFLDLDEKSIFLAYFGKISAKHTTFHDIPKFI
jgi:hypothetical protein